MENAYLKDWKVVNIGNDYLLTGKVYNRPCFDDGTEVTTSKIKVINFEKKICITKNTLYELR